MDNNQIVIYQTEDGLTKIEVNFDSETIFGLINYYLVVIHILTCLFIQNIILSV